MRITGSGGLFSGRGGAAAESITRDDVLYCYRALLRREPESQAVITHHLDAARTFRELVEIFVSSKEFRSRASESEGSKRRHVSVGMAHNEVETDATPQELADCLKRVKHAWTHLGEQRPHHSVLTQDEYLPEAIDTHLEAFRASGEHEVGDILAVLRRYMAVEKIRQLTVNELGCGVGRMTLPMAPKVTMVHGFDISAPHLAIAARDAEEMRIRNVQFHEVEVGSIPTFPQCDLFHTRIVLQHNPPPLIMALIAAMLRSIRPAGLVLFQVPTYIEGYRFSTSEWLRSEQQTGMEMHCVPMAAVFEVLRQHGFDIREVREDDSAGPEFISNSFVAQKAG